MDETAGPRLDDQLCFALYAAANALTRAYRPLLGALGLTYPQYLVLMVLWQEKTASVQAIADRLRLGPSAITPLLDRLEASGLVERSRHGADRRVVVITLTPQGLALQGAAAAAQHAVACRTGMSDTAMDMLRQELVALTERIAPMLAGLAVHEPA